MTFTIGKNLNLARKILRAIAGLATMVGCLTLGILHTPPSQAQSQAAAPLTFEVASVKRSQPGIRRTGVGTDPGRLTITNASLKFCIGWAYGVKDYQITGPDWLDAEYFDIVAKAGHGAFEDRLKLMMQALLADRFKLALHRETKELPIYALTVGKNGAKLHEVKPVGISRTGGGKGRLVGQRISMSQLADLLTQIAPREIDRPVIDRTGLKGVFDITLDWTPENQRQPGSEAQGPGATESASGPDIFRALQQQLGLRVEPQKGPVEILVIDHVEKVPTQN